MYQKYGTEAIILRSYERGEADRVFALYTKEFGFVWARASAVRRENSKMRYGLQLYAHATVSLVRGNRGWRLAGAAALSGIDTQNKSATTAFARIAGLVEHLHGGEEQNEYLFQTLVAAHAALRREPVERIPAIELLCVARVLYALGYVSAEALGTALFTHTAFTLPEITEAEAVRAKLLSSVNKAISETQML